VRAADEALRERAVEVALRQGRGRRFLEGGRVGHLELHARGLPLGHDAGAVQDPDTRAVALDREWAVERRR
jgi:hypothetical protein